jgi:RimJ/RimL family protein N-acetyltransferase
MLLPDPHRTPASRAGASRRRGARVRIRPFADDDHTVIDTVFEGLSPESRRRRYLAPVDRLTARARAALSAVDGERHVAFVAEVGRGRARHPIGVARYVVDAPGRAEIAYEVVDAWHGHGVGTRLVGALIAAAREQGLIELHATVLPDNAASLAVLRRHLPTMRVREDGGELVVSALLSASPLDADDVLADLRVA